MKRRKEYLVYFTLIVLAGGLSLLLVTDILEAKSEREEMRKTVNVEVKGPEDGNTVVLPVEEAVKVFKERTDLFSDLVTPIPTATKPPEATPTPTPVPLVGADWVIKNIMGSVVQITTGDKKTTSYKEGNTIPKSPPAPPEGVVWVIKKVDKANNRVFLWRKDMNVMGWWYKEGGVEYATEFPK